MDACLLCLESGEGLVGSIQVNSEKWNQQNLLELINIHLWPVQQMDSSSWICIECGRVLYDFHIFYKRIESAQQNYSAALKIENEVPALEENIILDVLTNENVGCKDNLCDKNASIIMEQPLPPEFVIEGSYIKLEKVDNFSDDDLNPKQIRKRGRPAKATTTNHVWEDPLKNPELKRGSKRKKVYNKKLLTSVESNTLENKKLEYNKNSQNSLDLKNNNDFDVVADQPTSRIAKTEKKNHRNLDEKILKEYDKIIADNFKIFCDLCQIEIDNFLSLRKHFKIEHKQRGYARCCKRNFYTRSLLVDHIHVHLNPEYFKCHHCSKVFSDRSRLLCHKKLHEDNSKLDKCDICGKLFADKGALKKHVLTHSSEKLFPCEICGKSFTNSFILNHHIEAVHENKFVQICDICGKSIRCPTAFASHMEKHEVKTTSISCDVCGLLLTHREGLKRHKNSQHPEGGKKEHTCHICAKVSPTERALKSHIRSVHEQGFDFKCNLCGRSFKRPAVLREHIATHTGTALYTCLWCPRKFISNGNMYNHRKNAHPKEWEELKRQKYAGNAS